MANYVTKCDNKPYTVRDKEEKKRKIKDALIRHPEGLVAKQLHVETGISYPTVRQYLRILVKEGEVGQKLGTKVYVSVTNKPYGIGEPPKIQNVRLNLKCPDGVKLKYGKVVKSIETLKIEVTFGVTNNQITACISAEPPMDLREFKQVIDTFKSMVRDSLNLKNPIDDKGILITSVELNNDFEGLRLDGIQSLTLNSCMKVLEKIYNKGNKIRREVRVRNISLESFYTLIKRGVRDFDVTQRMINMEKEIAGVKKAMKYTNSRQDDIFGLLLHRDIKPKDKS